MDDAERFRRALEEEGLRPGRTVKTITVGTATACNCGCGQRASVVVDSSGVFAVTSREMLEQLVDLLEGAADQVWGPKP